MNPRTLPKGFSKHYYLHPVPTPARHARWDSYHFCQPMDAGLWLIQLVLWALQAKVLSTIPDAPSFSNIRTPLFLPCIFKGSNHIYTVLCQLSTIIANKNKQRHSLAEFVPYCIFSVTVWREHVAKGTFWPIFSITVWRENLAKDKFWHVFCIH